MTTLSVPIKFCEAFSLQQIEEKKAEFLDLNLEPIIFKLVRNEDGESWTLDKALKHVQEYRCWLFISWLNPELSLPPSKKIDHVWHTHALDSELYRIQTLRLFGKFFDHFPYFGVRSELDKQNLNASFENTKVFMSRYSQSFGCDFTASCGNNCGGSLCDNNACDSNSCGDSLNDSIRSEEFLLSIRPDRNGITLIKF
jgi:hypothetical protein